MSLEYSRHQLGHDLVFPTAQRAVPLMNRLSPPGHHQAANNHQHRLSISKILQSSPEHHNGNLALHQNNNLNNNDHQQNLKFSIDNILKADFGRRITDPISLKKSRPKKIVPRPIDLTKDFLETSSEGSERGSEASTNNNNTSPSASQATTATSANSTSTSGASGNSSTTTDSGKQMLWPAWVYCTRYSDRPSSGKF